MTHTYKKRKFSYTPDEARVWDAFTAIARFIHKHGYSPSVREVMNLGDLKSTSYTLDCMKELENRGWIRRAGVRGISRDVVLTALGKEFYARSRPKQTKASEVQMEASAGQD